jgi:hypothetical protein
MSEKKLHYCLLTISFIISLYVYVDAYFVPLKPNTEVVTKMWSETHKSTTHSTTFSYHVATVTHSFRIPNQFYAVINVNDTIVELRSILTNVVQKMAVLNNGGVSSYYDMGILRADSSFSFMMVASIGIVLLFIFYTRVPFKQAKKNLTYFSFAVSLLFLTIYLIVNN